MPTLYCRHIRPSGRRCQSFALRSNPFCYHHATVNAHHRTLHPPDDGTHNILNRRNLDAAKLQREPLLAEYYADTRGPLTLAFPALEDADSVQLAISMLLTALGQNRIDSKRAVSMLYGLQVASSNVRKLTRNESCVVRDTLTDEDGNQLSPDEDPEEIRETQLFLQEVEQNGYEEEFGDDDEDDD